MTPAQPRHRDHHVESEQEEADEEAGVRAGRNQWIGDGELQRAGREESAPVPGQNRRQDARPERHLRRPGSRREVGEAEQRRPQQKERERDPRDRGHLDPPRCFPAWTRPFCPDRLRPPEEKMKGQKSREDDRHLLREEGESVEEETGSDAPEIEPSPPFGLVSPRWSPGRIRRETDPGVDRGGQPIVGGEQQDSAEEVGSPRDPGDARDVEGMRGEEQGGRQSGGPPHAETQEEAQHESARQDVQQQVGEVIPPRPVTPEARVQGVGERDQRAIVVLVLAGKRSVSPTFPEALRERLGERERLLIGGEPVDDQVQVVAYEAVAELSSVGEE